MRTRSRCRLFELPPELRIAIFEFALVSKKTVVTFRLDSFQRDSLQEGTQPALTRVSCQARHESLPIWYGCNAFVLHTEDSKGRDTQCWLENNATHLPLLKNLSLWVRRVARTTGQSSNGALGVNLHRQATDDDWSVSDAWDWITVTRKPSGLEADAKALIWFVRHVLDEEGRNPMASVDDWWYLLENMRGWYMVEKAYS